MRLSSGNLGAGPGEESSSPDRPPPVSGSRGLPFREDPPPRADRRLRPVPPGRPFIPPATEARPLPPPGRPWYIGTGSYDSPPPGPRTPPMKTIAAALTVLLAAAV